MTWSLCIRSGGFGSGEEEQNVKMNSAYSPVIQRERVETSPRHRPGPLQKGGGGGEKNFFFFHV